MEEEVKIKSYSVKELLALYDTTWKSFNSWIAPIKDKIGKLRGRKYTPKQVRIIFEHCGTP
jgi:hypothetical protein